MNSIGEGQYYICPTTRDLHSGDVHVFYLFLILGPRVLQALSLFSVSIILPGLVSNRFPSPTEVTQFFQVAAAHILL